MQLSKEIRIMLEKLTGKPYEKVTLDDIDKISPRINSDVYIHNAKMLVDILKNW